MEAPQKIYLQVCGDCPAHGNCRNCKFDEDNVTWSKERIFDKDIEYTSTDAFIEKAEEYLYKALNDGRMECGDMQKFIEDFKKLYKMTRKEEIINYANSFKGKGIENEEIKEIIHLAIIDGALWADEHPNIDAFIEKAVRFMKERLVFEDKQWHTDNEPTIMDKVIKDFKKYMKG